MATTNEIKQRFRDETINAVDGIVPSDNVRVATNEIDEEYPLVVFDAFENSGRVFLDETVRDENDEIVSKTYNEFITIVFDTTVLARSESDKDEIISSIRSHFSRYIMNLNPIDFHSHCRNVSVEGTQNADIILSNEVVRGDMLRIEIEFTRKQTVEV